MTLALTVWAVVSLLELGICLNGVWRLRKPMAGLLVVLVAAASIWLFAATITVGSGLILAISCYRIFNLTRIIKDRLGEHYIRRAVLRTSLALIAGQLIVLGIWQLGQAWNFSGYGEWLAVAGLQVVIALVLAGSTYRHLRTTWPPRLNKSYSDKELPTLTIAIPARNETDSLEECLKSIIASNYPKLEVLVLDDCSQTKRTPEIIRGFAHDGVEFIKGVEPESIWLAKNQAYQRLLDEANGELILFCGVDVRFEPGSLRALVSTSLQKKKSMISILPRNITPKHSQLEALLVQPMRYAWELSLPRKLAKRPPVLSTCWLARRDLLKKAGGFAGVSRSVSPESHFARVSIKASDGYSFLRSNGAIAIDSAKGISQQRDTAVRTRYPQLHRRPEQVCLMAAAQLLFLIAPFAILITALLQSHIILAVMTAVASGLLIYFYTQIITLTYRKFLPLGLIALPFAALSNLILLHYSMYKYEFSKVIWKGRNVCIPMMQVISRLPKVS